jgi:hypothetical protein
LEEYIIWDNASPRITEVIKSSPLGLSPTYEEDRNEEAHLVGCFFAFIGILSNQQMMISGYIPTDKWDNRTN